MAKVANISTPTSFDLTAEEPVVELNVRNVVGKLIAFKVKTTHADHFVVRPNFGAVKVGDAATVRILLVSSQAKILRDEFTASGKVNTDYKFMLQCSVVPSEFEGQITDMLQPGVNSQNTLLGAKLRGMWGTLDSSAFQETIISGSFSVPPKPVGVKQEFSGQSGGESAPPRAEIPADAITSVENLYTSLTSVKFSGKLNQRLTSTFVVHYMLLSDSTRDVTKLSSSESELVKLLREVFESPFHTACFICNILWNGQQSSNQRVRFVNNCATSSLETGIVYCLRCNNPFNKDFREALRSASLNDKDATFDQKRNTYCFIRTCERHELCHEKKKLIARLKTSLQILKKGVTPQKQNDLDIFEGFEKRFINVPWVSAPLDASKSIGSESIGLLDMLTPEQQAHLSNVTGMSSLELFKQFQPNSQQFGSIGSQGRSPQQQAQYSNLNGQMSSTSKPASLYSQDIQQHSASTTASTVKTEPGAPPVVPPQAWDFSEMRQSIDRNVDLAGISAVANSLGAQQKQDLLYAHQQQQQFFGAGGQPGQQMYDNAYFPQQYGSQFDHLSEDAKRRLSQTSLASSGIPHQIHKGAQYGSGQLDEQLFSSEMPGNGFSGGRPQSMDTINGIPISLFTSDSSRASQRFSMRSIDENQIGGGGVRDSGGYNINSLNFGNSRDFAPMFTEPIDDVSQWKKCVDPNTNEVRWLHVHSNRYFTPPEAEAIPHNSMGTEWLIPKQLQPDELLRRRRDGFEVASLDSYGLLKFVDRTTGLDYWIHPEKQAEFVRFKWAGKASGI